MWTRIILLISFIAAGNISAQAQPLIRASAEWQLTATEQNWLEKTYLPQRLAEARQLIGYVWNDPVSNLDDTEIYLHLRVMRWCCWLDGTLQSGTITISGDSPRIISIEIAWNEELDYGTILRHELVHGVGFWSGIAAWAQLGHGTIDDLFLWQILVTASKIYTPNTIFDPFRIGLIQQFLSRN